MSKNKKPIIMNQTSMSFSKILRSKAKNTQFKKNSNYQIQEKLGKGSFATVHKAVHKLTQQIVAVKVFSKSIMKKQEIHQVSIQVQIHKKLLHSNIVRLYEFQEDDQKMYIFMEYCQNGELFTFINENGPLVQKYASKVFKQILSALKYLKSQRIFHRDIKCENIMFDKNWNVKLVDFGFAKIQQVGCLSKTFCGSPSYNAPEVVQRQKYKAQMIDIWCLGVTLYAMLTSRLPFDGTTWKNTRQNIKQIKYENKKYFSNEVKQIFSKIFVEESQRSSIEEIEETQFVINGVATTSNFINFQTDQICFDAQILKNIKFQYAIGSLQIIQSITKFKLDHNCSLYYLLVKRQISKGIDIKSDIESINFKKKKKRSNTLKSIRLDQIIDKKLNEKKLYDFTNTRITIKREEFIIRPAGKSIELKSYRTTSRNTIQNESSTHRMFDHLSAYRPFTMMQ